MKWYDSAIYMPCHGTQVFVWDRKNQKQILLNAFWNPNAWKFNPNFPIWAYVLEGIEPVNYQPERLNPETPQGDAIV